MLGTTKKRTFVGLAALAGLAVVATACGSSSSSSSGGKKTPVKLQLQWVAQSQFAGYYAAKDQGFYDKEGLDVTILEGAVDIVPQTVLANGQADYAIAWVPKALASREQGAAITDVGQIFQRSGTLQVSWKDSNITKPADLKGKKVGNWGFGNEFELFAGLTKDGVDPKKDVTLVQQAFDMKALLNREIDAAQAMTYNEYAQVLESVNTKTGKLYTADDLNVINWNTVGTAMLQDAIWANTKKLSDKAYQDQTVKFLKASMEGWMYCRDNFDKCVDIVLKAGPKLPKTHQSWQLNEINKLIWPSSGGIGMIDAAAWKQTIDVATTQGIIKAAPDKDAYSNDYATKALAELKGDTKGTDFKPVTVTLTEGGK